MKKHYSLIFAFTTVFLCTGMSSPKESATETTMKNATSKHSVTTVKHHPAEQSSSYSKPHAGIELNYKRPKPLQVGESLELDLGFKVRAQAEQLWVVVNATDGLQLNSLSQYEFDASMQKKHNVTLQVDALQEGRMRLDVNATMLVDGKKQSRSFSIPVIVGDPANFKSGTTTAPGYTVDKAHGVISMPAMESSE